MNLCLDLKKKKKYKILDNFEQIESRSKPQDGIVDEKQRQEMVNLNLRRLPERQQIALNLCFYEGISNKEAAEIMDINLKALQSLIMRAKANLKEKLKKYYK